MCVFSVIAQLDTIIQVGNPVTNDEMTLIEDILDDFVDQGLSRKYVPMSTRWWFFVSPAVSIGDT